ncbi:hypothetical protein RF11_06494 [Thelohanellus kitauei]|uniref:Reverse transcriptase domain-containing protein n=1 Tax=Thelohanellus kitauei TaxID=669202 RepID=A0A0C2N3V8_THEKT|nr:hypothetical protein RF11_06494 [Thelohanellus kitauei]
MELRFEIIPIKYMTKNLEPVSMTIHNAITVDTESTSEIPELVDDIIKISWLLPLLDLKLANSLIHQTKKTSFSLGSEHSPYEIVEMRFSLTGRRRTFQRLMNVLFRRIPFVCVYLDDIIAFQIRAFEQVKHLFKVIEALIDAVLTLKEDKSIYFQAQFLEHQYATKECEVVTDAGNTAICAILEPEFCFSCYASRSCFGIAYALKQFPPFLVGKKFSLFCHNEPLIWALNNISGNRRDCTIPISCVLDFMTISGKSKTAANMKKHYYDSMMQAGEMELLRGLRSSGLNSENYFENNIDCEKKEVDHSTITNWCFPKRIVIEKTDMLY